MAMYELRVDQNGYGMMGCFDSKGWLGKWRWLRILRREG